MSQPISDPRGETNASSLAVGLTCLLILVALIDQQVVGAIAPLIASGLNSAKASVAGSVGLYAAAAAIVAFALGKYARGIRPAVWLPLGAVIFGVANLIAAGSPHIAVFLGARFLAGVAGALISALAIAALADTSTYATRGRKMSGVAVSYFLAPLIGVPFGIALAAASGWRNVFSLSAGLVIVAGLLVYLFPLHKRSRTLSGATKENLPLPTVEVEGTSGGGAGASAADLSSQPEQRRVSLWRLATSSRSTLMGIVSAFFVSGGLVGFTTFLATWLSDAFHASTRNIELVYFLAGGGAVAGGLLGGVLADKFGKRATAIPSSIVMAIMLLIVPTFTWSPLLLALITASAFVAALRVAPLQALITELVDRKDRAAYIALRNGSSQLGIAVSVISARGIYKSYGFTGIGLFCSILTLAAWLTIRAIKEPGGDHKATIRRRPLPTRLLKWAAVTLAIVAILVYAGLPFALSVLITKAGTRPGERSRQDTPADPPRDPGQAARPGTTAGNSSRDSGPGASQGSPAGNPHAGVVFENIQFSSSDGAVLSGWYLPGGDQGITIVIAHGLFRSRYETMERGIDLWRRGYSVLLYDLRRHGKSTGAFCTLGYDERHDVEAAANFARSRESGNKIVLMGVSMGAAAILLAAAEQDRVFAVISESSFLSFRNTARHHLGLLRKQLAERHSPLLYLVPKFLFDPLLIKFTEWRLNFGPGDFDLLNAVRHISVPILFIGSGDDVRMPNDKVLEPMYRAASNPLKEKFIVPGATHGHAYDTDPGAYIEHITRFLDTVKASS